MVYCKDCGKVFDEDEVIRTKNYVPYGMTQLCESTTEECPHCLSNCLVYDADIVTCESCGEEVLESDANYDATTETYYCNKC